MNKSKRKRVEEGNSNQARQVSAVTDESRESETKQAEKGMDKTLDFDIFVFDVYMFFCKPWMFLMCNLRISDQDKQSSENTEESKAKRETSGKAKKTNKGTRKPLDSDIFHLMFKLTKISVDKNLLEIVLIFFFFKY